MGHNVLVESIATPTSLLAPEFESVLMADLSDAHDYYSRFAEFAQYLDALSRLHDQALVGEAFTRQWSERELSVVYGVAATLLDVEVNTVRVEAGVDRALGTRHFRSASECLIVHDLYDRMFVELVRVMAQTVIESDDREIADDASHIVAAITAAVVAVSFGHDSLSEYAHTQLLANLRMVGFQSALTRMRITFYRRKGYGILPSVHMSVISDLIMALHELSHMHVRQAPPDAKRLVSMLASFSLGNLERFSEMVPGTQDVISFLSSKGKLKDAAVLAITAESEVDSLALDCLKRTGLYRRIDARTAACVVFGITLLEFSRKVGALLAGSSEPHEVIVKAKALAVLRLSNAIADILSGQDAALEDMPKQEKAFMTALFCYLLEVTGLIESLFVNGLRGIVVNSLSERANRLADKYPPSDDMRRRHDGSVRTSEIEKWAADQLLHNWADYSKLLRGTLRADSFIAKVTGEERLGQRNEDIYLYLKDEMSETQ